MDMKEKMKNNINLYGPFWKINFPGLVEIAGFSGWDFVIFDMEHATHSYLSLENLIRAAERVNLYSVIRIPENNVSHIVKSLDIGANCILVPNVSSKEEAERVVRGAMYPPHGERGIDVYARSASYGHIPKETYLKEENKKVTIAIQVEGLSGIKNILDILSISPIDIIFIGPYDLSKSMGYPGETHHPKVIQEMESIIEESKKFNKYLGLYVDTVEEARFWTIKGVQFIAFSVDTRIFYNASCSLIKELKKRDDLR